MFVKHWRTIKITWSAACWFSLWFHLYKQKELWRSYTSSIVDEYYDDTLILGFNLVISALDAVLLIHDQLVMISIINWLIDINIIVLIKHTGIIKFPLWLSIVQLVYENVYALWYIIKPSSCLDGHHRFWKTYMYYWTDSCLLYCHILGTSSFHKAGMVSICLFLIF